LKVIFVYPDVIEGASWPGYYYSGIGVLAAALKREGHETSLIHVTERVSRDRFQAVLSEHLVSTTPTLVAFSVTSNMLPFAREWSSWAKQVTTDPIIFGGTHPTMSPSSTIALPGVDIVCQGEGEGALLELCSRIQAGEKYSDIANLWVRSGDSVTRNPLRPLISKLDQLPFAERAIFDYHNLYHEREGQATVMVSRGCPYDCTYCCNQTLRKTYAGLGKYVRFRGVESAIKELMSIATMYKWVRGFVFDDDILPLDKRWFAEFAEAYGSEIRLPYACNIKPNLLSKEVVNLLAGSGCTELRMGIESGNERIRNEVMKRHLSEDKLLEAARLARERGIRLFSFNIVGLPGETVCDMLDTVKLNARIGSGTQRVTIFYPFQHTPLWELCREQGLLTNREVTDYGEDTPLRFAHTQRNQVIFIRQYFSLLVLGYRILLRLPGTVQTHVTRLIDKIIASRLVAHAILPIGISAYRYVRSHPGFDHFFMRLKHRTLG
jgi:anaerobic magnesium-protoporphyrin IX monomethyl ester cyclase